MILDDIERWQFMVLTAIITVALFFHASDWPEYRDRGRQISHVVIILGWGVICYRSWAAILDGNGTISLAGGLGLLLLSGGLILRSLNK